MTDIGFIGLGNMGGPMLVNLVKAGHKVKAFDLSADAMARAAEAGAQTTNDAASACRGVDVVVTMLPEGKHVRTVYTESILDNADEGALLIDCSTIDVATSRAVAALAAEREGKVAREPARQMAPSFLMDVEWETEAGGGLLRWYSALRRAGETCLWIIDGVTHQ